MLWDRFLPVFFPTQRSGLQVATCKDWELKVTDAGGSRLPEADTMAPGQVRLTHL